MRLSRSLGQVFLRDKEYINKILDFLDEGEWFLEIGPGGGAITEYLVKKAKRLWCVEVDSTLCAFLKNRFSSLEHVAIIHKNILEFPLSSLGRKVIVFGNIPYQISNHLIHYLIENRRHIKKAFLTFQKEFAHKLVAGVSTKPYSFLTCYLQYYAKTEKLFDIPRSAFSPSPKVDSAFVSLQFHSKPVYEVKNEQFLFEIIRKAFNQRRKKLSNALALKEKDELDLLDIDGDLRAENISLKEYVGLANKLYRG